MEIKVKNLFLKIIYLTLLILIINSCDSKKITTSKEGNLEDAIKYAVTEYSIRNKSSYEEYSSFFVDINDKNPDIYSFSISPNPIIRYYNAGLLSVSEIEKLPTDYLIINNQLYYWWDNKSKGRKDDLIFFKKYKLLVEDNEAYGMYSENTLSEYQKITYYYYCKKDLRNNIKVISSKTEDYFTIPSSFNCEESNDSE